MLRAEQTPDAQSRPFNRIGADSEVNYVCRRASGDSVGRRHCSQRVLPRTWPVHSHGPKVAFGAGVDRVGGHLAGVEKLTKEAKMVTCTVSKRLQFS